MNKKIVMVIVVFLILSSVAFVSYKYKDRLISKFEGQEIEISQPNSEKDEQIPESIEKEWRDNLTYKDLARKNSEGAVEMVVTFLNPMEENKKYWIFDVELDTHSVDLDQYDLSKLIAFKDDKGGLITDELIVKKEGAGHHMKTMIYLPKIIDHRPTMNEDITEIAIQISEIDDIANRLFVWDLTQLMGELDE